MTRALQPPRPLLFHPVPQLVVQIYSRDMRRMESSPAVNGAANVIEESEGVQKLKNTSSKQYHMILKCLCMVKKQYVRRWIGSDHSTFPENHLVSNAD